MNQGVHKRSAIAIGRLRGRPYLFSLAGNRPEEVYELPWLADDSERIVLGWKQAVILAGASDGQGLRLARSTDCMRTLLPIDPPPSRMPLSADVDVVKVHPDGSITALEHAGTPQVLHRLCIEDTLWRSLTLPSEVRVRDVGVNDGGEIFVAGARHGVAFLGRLDEAGHAIEIDVPMERRVSGGGVRLWFLWSDWVRSSYSRLFVDEEPWALHRSGGDLSYPIDIVTAMYGGRSSPVCVYNDGIVTCLRQGRGGAQVVTAGGRLLEKSGPGGRWVLRDLRTDLASAVGARHREVFVRSVAKDRGHLLLVVATWDRDNNRAVGGDLVSVGDGCIKPVLLHRDGEGEEILAVAAKSSI